MQKNYYVKIVVIGCVFTFGMNMEAPPKDTFFFPSQHRSILPHVPVKRDRNDQTVGSVVTNVQALPTVMDEDSFRDSTDLQKRFLLQKFCSVVSISRDVFWDEHNRAKYAAGKYVLGQNIDNIEDPKTLDAIKVMRKLCKNQSVCVGVMQQPDEHEPCRAINVLGADVCLYPLFFQQNAEQREELLRSAATKVGSCDAFCISTMYQLACHNRLSLSQQVQAKKLTSLYVSLVDHFLKVGSFLDEMGHGTELVAVNSIPNAQPALSASTLSSLSEVGSDSSGSDVCCGQLDRKKYYRARRLQR